MNIEVAKEIILFFRKLRCVDGIYVIPYDIIKELIDATEFLESVDDKEDEIDKLISCAKKIINETEYPELHKLD